MILDIDLSNVPHDEAERIKSGVKESNGETMLFGRNACVTDAGAIALAEALPRCKLKNILCVLGRITDVGAKAFAEALPRSNLKFLGLNCNQITDVGGLALLRAIPRSKVRELWLNDTSVSPTVQHAIIYAIRRRPHRDKLFLLLRLMVFWRFDGDNAMVYRVAEFLLG